MTEQMDEQTVRQTHTDVQIRRHKHEHKHTDKGIDSGGRYNDDINNKMSWESLMALFMIGLL